MSHCWELCSTWDYHFYHFKTLLCIHIVHPTILLFVFCYLHTGTLKSAHTHSLTNTRKYAHQSPWIWIRHEPSVFQTSCKRKRLTNELLLFNKIIPIFLRVNLSILRNLERLLFFFVAFHKLCSTHPSQTTYFICTYILWWNERERKCPMLMIWNGFSYQNTTCFIQSWKCPIFSNITTKRKLKRQDYISTIWPSYISINIFRW